MKWPPYLLKLTFLNHGRAHQLWLPLFLILPVVLVFLLVIFLLLLPFALLAMIFTWEPDWLRSLFLSVPAGYRLISHVPGLKIDLENNEGGVNIEFR